MNTTTNHRADEKVMAKRLLGWFSEEFIKKDKSKMGFDELAKDTQVMILLHRIINT